MTTAVVLGAFFIFVANGFFNRQIAWTRSETLAIFPSFGRAVNTSYLQATIRSKIARPPRVNKFTSTARSCGNLVHGESELFPARPQ